MILRTCLVLLLLAGCTPDRDRNELLDRPPDRLSDWRLFEVDDRDLKLLDGTVAYQLNASLFTDYAHKLRTLTLPEGKRVSVDDGSELGFPVGAVISKTFYFPRGESGLVLSADLGQEFDSGIGRYGGLSLSDVHLVETRLLVRVQAGWKALPYVWNESQTEARLKETGAVQLLELSGVDRSETFHYVVPDRNQCGGCHHTDTSDESLDVIGPELHNLARFSDYYGRDQLVHLAEQGFLSEEIPAVVPVADWQDQHRSLSDRARAYLDINCAHCHSRTGPGDTSGLFLNVEEATAVHLGICKPPIAAGQGTGGHSFSIVPGDPDSSILLYRMTSTDPGAMMPELGRSLVHREGVALISEWIRSLSGGCREDS